MFADTAVTAFNHVIATVGNAPFQPLHPLRYWGYQWWSGAGSDLSEITLLGIAIGMYKHHNCAVPRCLRIGRHPTADGQHKLCRKHHPDLPDHRLSLAEIHARHRAYPAPETGITTSHDNGNW